MNVHSISLDISSINVSTFWGTGSQGTGTMNMFMPFDFAKTKRARTRLPHASTHASTTYTRR